ncbi:MAG: GNAT family N-acetyltransferase, partial [Clostridiales bacterium]|nr:GNAT family N-acetyltransferase [Clostridiales bacterium]
DEQGVPEDEEFDGTDADCMHLILYDGDTPVAAGRVLWDDGEFRLGRVAVRKAFRGQGLGDFLMRLMIRKAFECGGETQYISAQTRAIGFYEKLGFESYGEEYGEAGIPHVRMKRVGDIG